MTLAVTCPLGVADIAAAKGLAPLSAQTSDAVIARDLAALDAWSAKLDSMPGAADDPWRSTAARRWLEAARTEYTDNDRHGFPQAAFERAVTLITELDRHAPVPTNEAPPPEVGMAGSVRVADSLYATLWTLKHAPGFRCAMPELANLEVELAWAGNEQVDQGDCRTSPHLARAIDWAAQAREKVNGCFATPVAAEPEPEVPTPVVEEPPPPPVVVPTAEELKIPRNVHFALGKDVVTETSIGIIGGIAEILNKYPSITVRLVGHTDSRGSAALNMDLSRHRVENVREVFLDLGIEVTRLSVEYKGKSELYSVEDSRRGTALNRRVEMVFVDSEGRDIKGEAQEHDLQLEQARPRRAPATPTKPTVRRPRPRRTIPPPATKAPATKAPATPATKAPATKAPATKAPATKAPATKAPATKRPATTR